MTIEKVLFSSRKEIETFKGRPNIAVISITDTNNRKAVIDKNFGPVLYLKFDDIDLLEDNTKTLFSIDIAKEIWEYVEKLPSNIETIWVHCIFGVSRSAGVAKAIAEYNNVPFAESYSLYNTKVYRTMRQAMLQKLYPQEDGLYI